MSDLVLEKLRDTFWESFANPQSGFYRKLYAKHGFTPSESFPATLSEWRNLPFLTKEDLVATPFLERLFVPLAHAGSIRVSSGTSGRGVAFIARNFSIDRSFFNGNFSRMMSLYFPQIGFGESCIGAGLQHIGADPAAPEASARMAAQFKIDALASASSALIAFTKHLETIYDTKRIRYVYLYGERPSRIQFASLVEKYPNARITWEYSNVETNGRSGTTCPELESLRDDRVHPISDRHYWELIDPETGRVIDELEHEGEIVLTTLWKDNPSPALRYRTGDLAKRMPRQCDCPDSDETFQILGRVSYDRAFIPGGELKSIELERVMETVGRDVHDDFELHILAKDPLRLILYVHAASDIDLRQLARDVERNLRINPTKTLASLVDDGRTLPLACMRFPESDSPRGKIRRIVPLN